MVTTLFDVSYDRNESGLRLQSDNERRRQSPALVLREQPSRCKRFSERRKCLPYGKEHQAGEASYKQADDLRVILRKVLNIDDTRQDHACGSCEGQNADIVQMR